MSTTSSWVTATDVAIQAHYINEFKKKPFIGEKFFTKDIPQIDSVTTEIADYHSLGDLLPMDEDGTFQETSFAEGYKTTIRYKKFGRSIGFTEEEMKFDKSGIIAKKSTELMSSARKTVEKIQASFWNNSIQGDTQADYVTQYGNGKNLFSTVHPNTYPGGSTFSNINASNITLTEPNLNTALLAMRAQTYGNGDKCEVKPRVLLLHPDQEKNALEILKSDKRSGTGDNDINVYNGGLYYPGRQLDIASWDYLSDSNQWYLIDTELNPAFFAFVPGMEPKVTGPYFEWKNRKTYWTIHFMCVIGAKGNRGVYASQGTGSGTFSS